MAIGLYHKWLKQENLTKLQGWKRNGLTDKQIAHNMGISVKTLDRWKHDFKEIREALKSGREEINFIVENTLLKKALSGNVTAIIFFLKNNWRDKYNDSLLSLEERELAIAKKRKVLADARISEAKALLAEKLNDQNNEQLDMVLNKLLEEAGTNGTSSANDKETN